MTDTVDLRLRCTVSAICLSEALLGKSLSNILAELQSEDGAELRTLRSLVAAGRVHLAPQAALSEVSGFGNTLGFHYDELAAGRLIEKDGIENTASQVGKAMAEFVSKLSRSPE